jgi:hypothetical protein
MEQELKQQIIREAQEHWNQGQLLETGKLLFEHIPRTCRPEWGAKVLETAYELIPSTPEIKDVIEFASQPEKWDDGSQSKRIKAHNFFDAVRYLTLQHKNKNPLFEGILILAENVAKVTYNAYGYNAPFDHDAGWWIVSNTKFIIDQVNNSEFAELGWSLLSDEKYIQLEKPTMCNPYCSTCYENGLTTIT